MFLSEASSKVKSSLHNLFPVVLLHTLRSECDGCNAHHISTLCIPGREKEKNEADRGRWISKMVFAVVLLPSVVNFRVFSRFCVKVCVHAFVWRDFYCVATDLAPRGVSRVCNVATRVDYRITLDFSVRAKSALDLWSSVYFNAGAGNESGVGRP